MNKKVVTLSMCVAVLVVAVVCVLLVGCNGNKDDRAYVVMEVNPSVEMVVDGNGTVLAVNGTNDDGKVLVQGEDLTGKNIDEVTVKIADLLVELKYVSEEDSKTMQIHVTAENSKLADKVNAAFDKGMTELKEHYNMAVNVAAATGHQALVESVLHCHPEMDRETVTAMSDTELIKIMQLDILDKAELPLVAMEEQFYKMKEMEFKFKYYDEMAAVLDNISELKVAAYNLTLETLRTGIEHLQELEKALIEKQAEGFECDIIVNGNSVMDSATQLALKAVDACIDGLQAAIDKLSEYEDEFGTKVDSKAVLDKAEQYINDEKNSFLDRYEKDYMDAINTAKKKIEDHKAAISGNN